METEITPPPIVAYSEPPVPEPVYRRTPAGWILLFAIFGLYGLMIVASTKLTNIAPVKNPYQTQETAVKAVLIQRSAMSTLSGLAGESKSTTTALKPDDDTLNKLEGDKKKDPRADRLLVAARQEYGLEQKPEDLAPLADSPKPADKAFAKIYSSKTLTKQEADSLEKQMPDDEFAYRLAKVHAADKAGDHSLRDKMSPPWKGPLLMLIFFLAIGVAFFGVVIWILYITYRGNGRLVPKGHPADPVAPADADRFAYRAGMLMTTFLLVEAGAGLALRNASLPLKTGIPFAIMLGLVYFIHQFPVFGMQIPLSKVGVTKKDLGKNVLWGMAGYAAMIPILAVCLMIGTLLMKVFGQSTHPVTEIIEAGVNAPTIIALYFSAAVAAPIWEEIMFRGTLLPAISGVLSKPVWGIVISSFVFAAIHPQGVPLWLALGSIGAMNACLAYQTKSLIPCMVVHALNNAIVLTLALLVS